MFQAARRTHKISDQIIEQIRNAILSGRFQPGDKVASEKELISQFGVSKATLREALRVLEGMGLVEIRKGIAGGVFIAEVDMKTTIHGIINFLHFQTVSIRDITMIRYFLEPPVAQIAASRIQPEDIDKLESMMAENPVTPHAAVSREIGFHRYLARMTGNPILVLIMDFIDNVLDDIKFRMNLGAEFYQNVTKSHRAVLECLRNRDAAGARREIIHDLLEVGGYMARLSDTPPFDPAVISGDKFAHSTPGAKGHPGSDILSSGFQRQLGGEVGEGLEKRGVALRGVGEGDL